MRRALRDAGQHNRPEVQAVQRMPATANQLGPMHQATPLLGTTTSVTYGPVNGDGVATNMNAILHPGSLGKGSRPTVKPPWWPTGNGATAKWFAQFMVQGHLLNHNIGGPGNTMANLTPLTKAANSAHHSNVEKLVKNEVLTNGNIVAYNVWADYSTHPTGKQLGATPAAVETEIDQKYADKMAGMIQADYTVYDASHNNLRSDTWQIHNDK
ncbi:hypothetical protein ACZ90_00720 [Streptomyces albus subsp. albus]|nr:hypothetical protein ACZ90_00720 [Streptomyces albus subsp. albus]